MKGEHLEVHPRSGPLTGVYTLPGDKSISHRTLFFGTLVPGIQIDNLAPGDDVQRTLELIQLVGYQVRTSDTAVVIEGKSLPADPLHSPVRIECGNSGTTARLGIGWLTGEKGLWKVTGDESLRARPMGRILDPLRRFGATFRGSLDRVPVSVIADHQLFTGESSAYGAIEVGSAQVHAGLTLAGLRSSHGLNMRRVGTMRDHTLRICSLLSLPVTTDGECDVVEPLDLEFGSSIRASGTSTVRKPLIIPGDFSSASFLIAAALLVPDSSITIEDVGLNPTRIAFLEAVRRMGAHVEYSVEEDAWEPVGTLSVRWSGQLRGEEFHAENCDIAGMADELPLLALLLATASGPGMIGDASELRVKESDRISATVNLLRGLGLPVNERQDGFEFPGNGEIAGGNLADPSGDHRLAMLAGVAGLAAHQSVAVRNPDIASVSWPDFWETLGTR